MVNIRPAREDDRAFVLDTAGRLSSFGPPPWRSDAEIVEGDRRALRAHFAAPGGAGALFVAEDPALGPAGFVLLEEHRDYFTGVTHAHVGILAVSAAAEGLGVARLLLSTAEAWSRARGFEVLTLNVFDRNHHAREVYEHVGFQRETIKYRKTLTPVEPRA